MKTQKSSQIFFMLRKMLAVLCAVLIMCGILPNTLRVFAAPVNDSQTFITGIKLNKADNIQFGPTNNAAIVINFTYQTTVALTDAKVKIVAPAYMEYDSYAAHVNIESHLVAVDGSNVVLNLKSGAAYNFGIEVKFKLRDSALGTFLPGDSLATFSLVCMDGTDEGTPFIAGTITTRSMAITTSEMYMYQASTELPAANIVYDVGTGTARLRIRMKRIHQATWLLDPSVPVQLILSLPAGIKPATPLPTPSGVISVVPSGTVSTGIEVLYTINSANYNTTSSTIALGGVDMYIPIEFDNSVLNIALNAPAVPMAEPVKLSATYTCIGGASETTPIVQRPINLTNTAASLIGELDLSGDYSPGIFRGIIGHLPGIKRDDINEYNRGALGYGGKVGVNLNAGVLLGAPRWGFSDIKNGGNTKIVSGAGNGFNSGLAPVYNHKMVLENGVGDIRGGVHSATISVAKTTNGTIFSDPALADAFVTDVTTATPFYVAYKINVKGGATPRSIEGRGPSFVNDTNGLAYRSVVIYANSTTNPPPESSSNNTNVSEWVRHLILAQGEVIESIEAWPVSGAAGEAGRLPPAGRLSIALIPSWPKEGQSTLNNYEFTYPDGTIPKAYDVWQYPSKVYGYEPVQKIATMPLPAPDSPVPADEWGVPTANPYIIIAPKGKAITSAQIMNNQNPSGMPGGVIYMAPFLSNNNTGNNNTNNALPNDKGDLRSNYTAVDEWKNIGMIFEYPKNLLRYDPSLPIVKHSDNLKPGVADALIASLQVEELNGDDFGKPGKGLLRITSTQAAGIPLAGQLCIKVPLKVKQGLVAKSYNDVQDKIYTYLYSTDDSMFLSPINFTKNSFYAYQDITDITGLGQAFPGRNAALRENAIYVKESFLVVTASAELEVSSYVKGDYSGDEWTKVETTTTPIELLPGGKGEFRLVIENTGNIGIKNIKLLDILPYYQDQMVGSAASRGSMWTPIFNELKIEIKGNDSSGNPTTFVTDGADGAKLEFTASRNPDRRFIENTTNWQFGDTATKWYTSGDWSGSLSDIASFRYDSGSHAQNVLHAGNSIEITGSFLVPQGAPMGVPTYNSFAMNANYAAVSSIFTPYEYPLPNGYKVVDNGKAQIGSFVFVDTNGNNVYDNNESGLNNVNVTLYKCDNAAGDNPVHSGTKTTAKNASNRPGYYLFSNLERGFYKLEFELPTSMKQQYNLVQKNVGLPNRPYYTSRPNNAAGADYGFTEVFEVETGKMYFDRNAGYAPAATAGSISGKVLKNDNVTPIGNVEVRLYKAQGNAFLSTTTTLEDGTFSFNGLETNTAGIAYKLTYFMPSGILVESGVTGGTASSSAEEFYSDSITLTTTINSNSRPDLLVMAPNANIISGIVWQDTREDQTYGSDDAPLSLPVVLKHFNGTTTTVKSTETSEADGSYRFYNIEPLLPGEKYILEFQQNKEQFIPHTALLGTPGTDKNKAYAATVADYPTIVLTETEFNGTTLLNQNAALLLKNASDITVVVFHDKNGNGLQDTPAAEQGVQGLEVKLTHESASPPVSGQGTSSLGDGKIEMPNLPEGDYKLYVDSSTLITGKELAGSVYVEYDAPWDVDSATYPLDASNEAIIKINLNNDAKIYIPLRNNPPSGEISGRVWYDSDGDGIIGTGEELKGPVGLEVSLYKGDTFFGNTPTTADGEYEFTGLIGGEYKVRFALPAAPTGGSANWVTATGTGKANKVIDVAGDTEIFVLLEGTPQTEVHAGLKLIEQVNFDAKNGLPVPSTYTAAHGTYLTKPVAPTREHYTFEGWYKNSNYTGTEWQFVGDASPTPLDGSMTLYAKWETVKYTVDWYSNYNASDNTSAATQSTGTVEGVVLPLAAPTRTGYSFEGWNLQRNGAGVAVTAATQITSATVVYSIWAPNKYTVRFDAQAGSAVDNILNVSHDTTIIAPSPPTRKGYTFGGWYKEMACTSVWTFASEVVVSNTTLYAKWTQETYTVTYNYNDGVTANTTASITYGGTLIAPIAPLRVGYAFAGWYENAAGTGTEWNFANSYPYDTAVTLHAKWVPGAHSIIYNWNDGTVNVYKTQPILFGANTNTGKPAAPLRTGYVFGGWFTEAACTTPYAFPAIYTTAGDSNLYAKWAANNYTVTYNQNYAGKPADTTQTLAFGTALAAPAAPTRAGYNFAGWYETANAEGAPWAFGTYTRASNLMLYAKWGIKTFTVQFHTDGGTPVAAQTIEHGSFAAAPTLVPTRTGYNFVGWFKESTLTTAWNFGTMPITSNADAYAKWLAKPCSVSFSTLFGTMPLAQTVPYNGYATLPQEPVDSRYSFTGWYTGPNATGSLWNFGTSQVQSENISLFAHWVMNPVYTVTYFSNGNNSGAAPVNASEYLSGETIVAAGNTGALVKEGYTFNGWNTRADGLGIQYAAGAPIVVGSANISLYTNWLMNEYSVQYHNNSGNDATLIPVDMIVYNFNDVVTVQSASGILHDTQPTEFIYDGWNTEADGSGIDYPDASSFLATQTTELYVKWVQLKYITYNANGATGTPLVDINPYLPSATISIIDIESVPLGKEGHSFAGWNTAQDGTGTVYNTGDTVIMPISEYLVLYAQWAPLSYTLHYNSNGANSGDAPADETYLYSAKVSTLGNTAALSKAGHIFSGWSTQPTDEAMFSEGSFFFMPAGNIELFACWTANILKQKNDLLELFVGPTKAEINELTATLMLTANQANYSINYLVSDAATAFLFSDADCTTVFNGQLPEAKDGSETVFYIKTMAEDPVVTAKVYKVIVVAYDSSSSSGSSISESSSSISENSSSISESSSSISESSSSISESSSIISESSSSSSSEGGNVGNNEGNVSVSGSSSRSSSSSSRSSSSSSNSSSSSSEDSTASSSSSKSSSNSGDASGKEKLVLSLSTAIKGEMELLEDRVIILQNKQIVVTPNISGGKWKWDEEMLSASFNSPATFTGLKVGETLVYYTVGGISASVLIEVRAVPDESTNWCWLWWLLLIPIAIIIIYLWKRNRASKKV